MKLKDIKQIKNLTGKRVLLRLDLNVPIEKGEVPNSGTWRLERAIPTIKYLTRKKARVIIVAHLGRPEGKVMSEFTMQPVCEKLSQMLGKTIEFWADDFSGYIQDSEEMSNGSVAMIENIRFYREKKNCKRLATRLSKLADIYVNDAFGNVHRQDASMHAITYYLPSYAGLLMTDEVNYLSKVLKTKKGLSVILGGAKVATKIKLIEKFSKMADHVCLGGILANTMLKALDYKVGKSVYDKDFLALAKRAYNAKKVHLPEDLVVCKNKKSKNCQTVEMDKIPAGMMSLDLGPKTIKKYLAEIKAAKLIVWNGPFGYFENKLFVQGSKSMMKGLVKLPAKVIIGGGETVELANQLKLSKEFTFVSTGGGAMLAFLQGNKLPSLERLKK
ncbi:phosphoglycerate kinase [Candidatus Parcubacteria bacterium]|jgi:phosphoglycerate kinase|nr:phosphoglycerate kinase [Candidatus Parcubacteria bacterium]